MNKFGFLLNVELNLQWRKTVFGHLMHVMVCVALRMLSLHVQFQHSLTP